MIIDKYIRREAAKHIIVVMCLFALLNVFVYLSLQIANNKGLNWQTFSYGCLLTPRNLYRALTLIVLFSGAMTMYQMQQSKEWLIMTSFGNSHRRLFANIILVQFVFILIMAYVGETIAIDLERYAKKKGTYYASKGEVIWNFNNLWFKEGDVFIHINRVVNAEQLEGIDRLIVKDDQLSVVQHAKSATFIRDGLWQMQGVSNFNLKSLEDKKFYQTLQWHSGLHPSVLVAASETGARLSLHRLFLAVWNSKNLGILAKDSLGDLINRLTKPIITFASLCCLAPIILLNRPRGYTRLDMLKILMLMLVLIGVQQELPSQYMNMALAMQMILVCVGALLVMRLNQLR